MAFAFAEPPCCILRGIISRTLSPHKYPCVFRMTNQHTDIACAECRGAEIKASREKRTRCSFNFRSIYRMYWCRISSMIYRNFPHDMEHKIERQRTQQVEVYCLRPEAEAGTTLSNSLAPPASSALLSRRPRYSSTSRHPKYCKIRHISPNARYDVQRKR